VKQIEQLTQIVTKRRVPMAARANGRVGEYRGASRRNGSARAST
jgi:hypothetical protein